jgi:hypothetical protein
MKFILTIWNYIKDLKLKHLAIFAFILAILFGFYQCHRNNQLKNKLADQKEKTERYYNNYKASKDSLRLFKNKFKNTVAEKRSYEFTIKELKNNKVQLKKKYQKALKLNKNLKNTISLLEQKIKIRDTVQTQVTNNSKTDTTGTVTFSKYNDYSLGNTRFLEGNIDYRFTPDSFYFDQISIRTKQTISVKTAILQKENGGEYVRLTTSYPNTQIERVENINILNNRINTKRTTNIQPISLGLHIGYGMYTTPNSGISTGPVISAGIQWTPKFLRFNYDNKF